MIMSSKAKVSISAISIICFGIGIIFNHDLVAGILTDDGRFSNVVFRFYVDLIRFVILGGGVTSCRGDLYSAGQSINNNYI